MTLKTAVKAEQEILEPEKQGGDTDDGLPDQPIDAINLKPVEGQQITTSHYYKAKLVTTGQIKTELGRVYRAMRNRKINTNEALVATRILLGMLEATKQEHAFALQAENPDDDRPALSGLVLIGAKTTEEVVAQDPIMKRIVEDAMKDYRSHQKKGEKDAPPTTEK